MKKIKIMFELSSLGYGGTEKAIYTFIENMNREKFDICIFFSTDYKTLPYYRRKVKSYFSNKAKEKFTEKYSTYFKRLSDFQTKVGIDNVIIGNSSHFFKVINHRNLDIIHFSRGVTETFYTKDVQKIPSHIKLVETNIFGKDSSINYIKRLEKVFCISKWLQKSSSWIPKEKSSLLYNPIKLPENANNLKKLYNIPSNALVLGRMSRPNLDDGEFIHNVLTKVLHTSIYFISIGSSKKFQHQMKAYKNIIFIDPVTDTKFISSFYNTIDILLHYRKEGETFGMNIAEAMIHGKTVVSHYSYLDNAQAELLLEDKDSISGIVVKENNISEYIEAIQSLLSNKKLREELSKNAKKRSEKLFAEDKVTSFLENEYLSISSSVY